jgi:L-fuculose-phosphate aldolase
MVAEISIHDRQELKSLMTDLITLGKDVVGRGLVVGSGGNLSFRVPGEDTFFITGTGTRLDQLTVESFAQVTFEGEALSSGVKPSSEFRVHLESYKSRPDIQVCVHLHPQASVLTASLNLEIKFVTIDHVYYVRKVDRIPWIRSGTPEIGEAVGGVVKGTNVVILENHGCVVLASNVELAHTRVLNLEEAAELTLRCHQLGIDPIVVPQAYWDHLKANSL